jgi:hypothetical protein
MLPPDVEVVGNVVVEVDVLEDVPQDESNKAANNKKTSTIARFCIALLHFFNHKQTHRDFKALNYKARWFVKHQLKFHMH